MNYHEHVMQGIKNQTVVQTIGKAGIDRAEALLARWQQLFGMGELALLLGAARELQDAIQLHKDEVLADFRVAEAELSHVDEA